MTVRAIYENGVFRPIEPVKLPDKSRVEFDPKILGPDETDPPGAETHL